MVGAGGLKFIDPLYQRVLIQECRKRGLPIVYDEVAVGMYRLGPATASTILLETPDIAVYGKLISGGYLPIAATLTTAETFQAFLGKKKWHALLHGHSYTANPMACIGDLPTPVLYYVLPSALCPIPYIALLHGHSYTANPMACIGDLSLVLCNDVPFLFSFIVCSTLAALSHI